jgi:hypothetical protein
VKEALPAAAHGKPIEIWFQDEADRPEGHPDTPVGPHRLAASRPARQPLRMGLPVRRRLSTTRRRRCPGEPYANSEAMNLHLREIGRAVDPRAHAVLVLDGAGWHTSHIVTPPDNVTLLCLPWAVADCVTDGQDICSGTLFAHHESLMTNEAPNRFPRLVKGWALIMSLRLIPPRKRKCAVTPRYADIGVEGY